MTKASAAGRIINTVSGDILECDDVTPKPHCLVVSTRGALALRTFVRVEAGNRMWMGEVWACEPDAQGFLIEIEVQAALHDVAGVERLADRFRHERPGSEAAGDTNTPQTKGIRQGNERRA